MAPFLDPYRTAEATDQILGWGDNDFDREMRVRLGKGKHFVPKSYYEAVKQADMGMPIKNVDNAFDWLCDQVAFIWETAPAFLPTKVMITLTMIADGITEGYKDKVHQMADPRGYCQIKYVDRATLYYLHMTADNTENRRGKPGKRNFAYRISHLLTQYVYLNYEQKMYVEQRAHEWILNPGGPEMPVAHAEYRYSASLTGRLGALGVYTIDRMKVLDEPETLDYPPPKKNKSE